MRVTTMMTFRIGKQSLAARGAALLAVVFGGLLFAGAALAVPNAPLGLVPSTPLTSLDNSGTLQFNAAQGLFQADLKPSTTNFPPQTFVFPSSTDGLSYVRVQLHVDAVGQLVGGVAGDDFVMHGGSDPNGDFVPELNGTLLTGEVIAFGFTDTGTAQDRFSARIRVTGGLLASYFAGKDIGLIMTSENSSFVGSFSTNFSGTFVKGSFGTVPTLCLDVEKQVRIGAGAWVDADNVGDADVPSASVPSDAEYRFIVANCGGSALENLVVTDAELGVSGANSYTIASLAVGASATLTSAEIPQLNAVARCDHAGTLINSVSVSAESSSSNEVLSDTDTAVVECVTVPSIRLIKQISVDGGVTWFEGDDAGTTPSVFAPHGAEYRFIVTNDGTADLTNVVLSDPTLGVVYNIGSLTVGQQLVLGSGSIPGAAVAERCATPGEYQNVASVSGADAANPAATVTDSDPANLLCLDDGTPGIEIIKQISIDGSVWADADNAGDADVPETLFPSDAQYRIVVRNTGDVELVNVVLNDVTLNVIDYLLPNLAVGAEVVLTQGNLPALYVANRCTNSGTFTNSAEVSAESVNNANETVTDSDTAVMTCVGEPGLEIVKLISVNGVDYLDANDAASAPSVTFPADAQYRFVVTNTGSAPLINVLVNDATLGINNYVVGSLDAGASITIDSGTLPAMYAADRCTNSGTFTNVARVDGDSAETGEAVTDDDPAVLVCIGEPNIELLKQISVDGGATWADADQSGDADVPSVVFPHGAEYRLVVRNTGTIGLTNIVVNDADLSIVDQPVAGTLAAGGEIIIGSGEIAALSVAERCNASGEVINSASVSAESVDTGSAVSDSDTAVLECVGSPSILVLKQISLDGNNWADADAPADADVPQAFAPSSADYRFIVRNNGTSPLTNVLVDDAELGIAGYAVGDLAVGAEVVITSGQIAALHVAERCNSAGTFANVVDVTAQSTETGETVGDSDPAHLICNQEVVGVCEIDVDLTASFGSNPLPVDCADCEGKVSSLTLRYNGNAAAFIVVKQKGDGAAVFSGEVAANSTFSFVGTWNGTLSTEIDIYVDGVLSTSIHTSCSEAINTGMDFGPFTVVAGESKVGGALCPVDGQGGAQDPSVCDDVTYTYTLNNLGDAVNVTLEDDTYDLGLDIFEMAAGETKHIVNQVCVSEDTTNTATALASLLGNGAITCGDEASVSVYCADETVLVQKCTYSSSYGETCSQVEEVRKVCSDTPPPPEPIVLSCGDTVEIEQAAKLTGGFELFDDASASGGKAIRATSTGAATVKFNLPEDKTVQFKAQVRGLDGASNSFFFDLAGQQNLWDTPYGASYVEDYLSDRNGADPVTAVLGTGEHSLVIKSRELGTRLDTITLECSDVCEEREYWVQKCTYSSSYGETCSWVREVEKICGEPEPPVLTCGNSIEAEDADLSGAFAIIGENGASGGKSIVGYDANGVAGFRIQLDESKVVKLKGTVRGQDGYSNSFFFDLNGKSNLWDTPYGSSYVADYLSNRGGQDPVTETLAAGEHQLSVKVREPGTRLDKIAMECSDVCTNEEVWVQQCTYSSSYGEQCGWVKQVREVCPGDQTLDDGQSRQMLCKHGGKAIDVSWGSHDNGANILQWHPHTGANQQWILKSMGNGYHSVVSKNSGKCLDVGGWGTHNGANVLQWACHGGDNQQWKLEPAGDGYYSLRAKHSGKCLDVNGVSTDAGANLHQWSCHGGDNQKWRFK